MDYDLKDKNEEPLYITPLAIDTKLKVGQYEQIRNSYVYNILIDIKSIYQFG